MTVLIPAFEPDERLLLLIEELRRETDYRIVVVDDGSGPGFQKIFLAAETMNCTILTHPANRGKGRALKTGLDYILGTNEKAGVVTADADGQHLVRDIIRIASAIPLSQNKMVLGERKFIGKVPVRSIIGNKLTRMIFALVSGEKLSDTQTGLRGFPCCILPWLVNLEGERFEYEMNMLLRAKTAGVQFAKIEIETVYSTDRHSSHFRTVRDSILVYLPFFKFCLSGICGCRLCFAFCLSVDDKQPVVFRCGRQGRKFGSQFYGQSFPCVQSGKKTAKDTFGTDLLLHTGLYHTDVQLPASPFSFPGSKSQPVFKQSVDGAVPVRFQLRSAEFLYIQKSRPDIILMVLINSVQVLFSFCP